MELSSKDYALPALWISALIIAGLMTGINIAGWVFVIIPAFLIWPRYWQSLQNNYTAVRMFIAVLISVFLFYGAFLRAGENPLFGRSEVEEAVSSMLRDPSSAQFRDIIEGPSATCGMVNGKNGFGAYDGFKRFVYVDGNVLNDPEPPIVPSTEQQTAYYNDVAAFAAASRRCYE